MVDIEVVIQELESAANEAVADVQNEINEKQRLEEENKRLQVRKPYIEKREQSNIMENIKGESLRKSLNLT